MQLSSGWRVELTSAEALRKNNRRHGPIWHLPCHKRQKETASSPEQLKSPRHKGQELSCKTSFANEMQPPKRAASGTVPSYDPERGRLISGSIKNHEAKVLVWLGAGKLQLNHTCVLPESSPAKPLRAQIETLKPLGIMIIQSERRLSIMRLLHHDT